MVSPLGEAHFCGLIARLIPGAITVLRSEQSPALAVSAFELVHDAREDRGTGRAAYPDDEEADAE